MSPILMVLSVFFVTTSGTPDYKVLEMTTKMSNGYSDASIVQAGSIAKAKDANLDARNAALQLRSGIISLNTELANTITLALDNPFYVLDKGAKQLANTTKEVANNIQRIGKQAREITPEMTAPVLMERGAAPTITNVL